MKKLIGIFLLTIGMTTANSQVVINEYSCSNFLTLSDNYGNYNDWIELHNTSASTVNLTGFFMSDNANNPQKWIIPGGSIPAGGKIIIQCSGRDEFSGGYLHSTFKLTQTKPEVIILADAGGNIIDQVTLDPTLPDHSRGRTTDGGAAWALFTSPTPNNPNSGSVNEYVARPVMSQPAGNYSGSVSVSISCATSGATIYYTTDGSEPTTASTVYSAPVNITSTTVLRARAFLTGTPDSFTESNTYFINVDHTIPTISVFGGSPVDALFNGSYGDPITTIEYFDANETFVTEAQGTTNKHGNDSWAYDQRGVDFVARDQYGYGYALQEKFFPTKSRDKFQRVILKPAANDNYPFETGGAHIRDAYVHTLSDLGDLKLDERTSINCILYLNGQYWGVYEIREKVDDDDFLDYYYDQWEQYSGSDNYIQYLKTWGNTWSEYGNAPAQNDWNALRTFITSNSMAVQANFDYVDSLFNWKSLVDYFVLNSVCVTSDWLNWNTAWWHGLEPNGDKKKWRYTLWDMDATFGHYINYTGVPTTAPTADPCNVENLPDPGGQGHTDIITDLMANPTFEQYYISRYIDLNNTVFSCANMILVLDSMINVITPEMQGQINKWGGTFTEWQTNVQALRDYIDTRCVALQTGLVNCYNLSGPYNLTINVDPPNSGWVDINSIGRLDAYPWTATYYGGIDILLEATPDVANSWEFDYWEVQNGGTISPSTDSTDVALRINGNETVIAHFKTPTGGFLPTAFSPNDDGFNDVLRVLGEGIASMNLTIYNRWGEMIINISNPADGWDGLYKGEPAPAGVYAYKLSVTFADGEFINQSGNITLIR